MKTINLFTAVLAIAALTTAVAGNALGQGGPRYGMEVGRESDPPELPTRFTADGETAARAEGRMELARESDPAEIPAVFKSDADLAPRGDGRMQLRREADPQEIKER